MVETHNTNFMVICNFRVIGVFWIDIMLWVCSDTCYTIDFWVDCLYLLNNMAEKWGLIFGYCR